MAKHVKVVLLFFSFLLLFATTADADLPHKNIEANSNAIAFDQKLLLLEQNGASLWAHNFYSQKLINSVKKNTLRDAWTASNLSYSLQALARENNNFILPLLNRAILNYETGDYYDSFRYLKNAKGVMESLKQKGFILTGEQKKIFKGESYEQAMANFYMGLMLYQKGDYQNARASFASALDLDREIIPNQKDLESLSKSLAAKDKELTAQDIIDLYNFLGNDNRIAHYMLARAWMKLGEEQNVNISLRHANKWKKVPQVIASKMTGRYYKMVAAFDVAPPADNPYAKIERLRNDNLVMLIEMGFAPTKELGGFDGNKDMISVRAFPERKAKVFVDGKELGEAYPIHSLLHQAICAPRTAKDTAQSGKAAGKFAVTLLASIISSDLAETIGDKWSVAADTRRWGTLPNEIHLISGKVEPGLHNITVLFYDVAGNPLPHYEQVLYFVPVRDDEKTFFTIRAIRDKHNMVQDFYGSKIIYDQKKNEVTFNPRDLSGVQVGDQLDLFTIDFGDQEANTQFMTQGLVMQYGYYMNSEIPAKQKFDSMFKNFTIKKIGEVRVTKVKGNKATSELVEGGLALKQEAFVTNYRFAVSEIKEANHNSLDGRN